MRCHGKHLGRRLLENGRCHLRLALCICTQQRAVAKQVDAARHAPRQGVDHAAGFGIEGCRAGAAGHIEPVLHILLGLFNRQRLQMEARNHALRQLFELGPCKHVAQLRLADQHDLQELAFMRLEVGQQAQLLQHIRGEVLRLVDDQYIALALRVSLQQVGVDRIHILFDRMAGRRLDVKFLADGLQQLGHRQLRVEDVGHIAAARDLLEEAAADGGLACADFTR